MELFRVGPFVLHLIRFKFPIDTWIVQIDQLNSVGTSIDGNEVAIEKAAIRLGVAKDEGGYNLVDVETLNTWVSEDKEMVIIDTMPADSYSNGFIPGAVNAELPKSADEEITAEQKEAFIKALGTDKDATIVVYCGFTACERSHFGAEIAVKEGFKNVYRLPGGIVAWQNAEYEVAK